MKHEEIKPPTYSDRIRHTLDELDRHRVHLDNALEYAEGSHTFDDLVHMVLTGRLHMWSKSKSIILAEVLEYPQEKHYHMFLGGGDFDEIVAMHEEIETAAKNLGCVKLSVCGRRGWVRGLAKYGWAEQFTTVTKRI